MLQAMLSGVASIKAQQTRMSTIGNDLANINTTAFKSSDTRFAAMLSQTVRGATRPNANLGGVDPTQFGLGVVVAGTAVDDSQGSLNATNNPSDMAIQGNGYFMVSNGSAVSYTRDGGFALDANGDMVQTATGQRLLGWTADPATGNIDTSQPINSASALKVPLGNRTAVQATTQVTWAGNLDSRVFGTPNSGATSSTEQVFDTLGSPHNLTINVTKDLVSSNKWDYTITSANGDTVTGGAGTFTFNAATGVLSAGSPVNVTVTPPAATGTPAFTMSMDFSKISQVASNSSMQASAQNGYEPGSLSSYTIGNDGVITGLYTNGLTRALGQVALTIFPNAGGLSQEGSNLWQASDNSGVPVVGSPSSGGRGVISSGFLEQSNVDISTEFTNLIVTQRGFQANTKVVTSVDQMLQDVINMKQ